MTDLLQRIADSTRTRVARQRKERSLDDLLGAVRDLDAPISFSGALTAGEEIAVIAELKRASPSEGVIRDSFEPGPLAADLARGGAAALSILTEPEYFRADGSFVAMARESARSLPLLRKDFILDPWQVWESRLLGADAILLIVTLLSPVELEALLGTARDAGLDVLVEAKSGEEIDRALDAGAEIVGVNARDLSDFSVDLSRVAKLAGRIPPGVAAVAESGISGGADLMQMERAGFAAALVGTRLMRAASPGAELERWLSEKRGKGTAR